MDTGLDDFGLIDYESPSTELHEAEPPESHIIPSAEPQTETHSIVAGVVISYHEMEEQDAVSAIEAQAETRSAGDALIDYDEMEEQDAISSTEPYESETAQPNTSVELDEEDYELLGTEPPETGPEQPAASTDDQSERHSTVDALIDYHEIEEQGLPVSFSEHQAKSSLPVDTVLLPSSDPAVEDEPTQRAADHQTDELEQISRLRLDNVPETWVYSTEWMIYLGPEQRSFDAEAQMGLFRMPLDELIEALRRDILLREEDAELVLEFPSLALVIDRRDEESKDISLQQIYNCHVAAVSLGTVSVDLVNSPYFTHSSATNTINGSYFYPTHESFAFIIHTRPSVHATLTRIMQVAGEFNNNSDEQVKGKEADDTTRKEHEEGEKTAAEMLANEYEEEDEDDDFVAGEEEEADHVLEGADEEEDDDELLDEDEEDEEDDGELDEGEEEDNEQGEDDESVGLDQDEETGAAQPDDNVTHVGESGSVSPSKKRTIAQTDAATADDGVDSDHIDLVSVDIEDAENEPVAKKPKSANADEQVQIVTVDE
ncbi:hypothetical protein GGI25_005882 [Coemansia spiralis]|uniref:Uncharacterized protein n=2 Tax=Coemansia TaxID=4863 RepID=A0A9W8G1G1_9FUNG|nr:hypothetical protein BX070DRAFT_222068 [Coemansia spiralis]KAJ1992767.1 hypothetical protein EDC05_002551 [Coemansia umbellata]KAJ2622576.1 hypothetical protein GGI26_003175 [Coemansia sp. RSA 1358]KAJ2670300.1 hypothetical protein GGI25_005882 [Coemansia spiralis]